MIELPQGVSNHLRCDEPPPFLGTWRRVYLAVASWLGFLILTFYLFARSSSS